MSQSLRRLACKAKEEPQLQFTAIAHLLTEEVYWAAWRRLKKGASTGVDGVTATAYAANLAGNLRALLIMSTLIDGLGVAIFNGGRC